MGALPAWVQLHNQDIAIFGINGRDNFYEILKFVKSFAIPWAILCDGEALWDLSQKNINPLSHVHGILKTCGITEMPQPEGDPGKDLVDFKKWREKLEPYGIYSLAQTCDEGFEKVVKALIPDTVWQEACNLYGDNNKVLVARYIAETCVCPKPIDDFIQRIARDMRDWSKKPPEPLKVLADGEEDDS